jgi:hypothetical protein
MTDETSSSSGIMENIDNLTDQLSQVRTRLGMNGPEGNRQRLRSPSDRRGRTWSLGSSSSRKTPSLLTPVARMQLNQLQKEVAEAQKQRMLARIGQLYLEQHVGGQIEENAGGLDEDDRAPMDSDASSSSQGSGSLNPSLKEDFYHGFNPPDELRGNPYPPPEDWVHIPDHHATSSRDAIHRLQPLSGLQPLSKDGDDAHEMSVYHDISVKHEDIKMAHKNSLKARRLTTTEIQKLALAQRTHKDDDDDDDARKDHHDRDAIHRVQPRSSGSPSRRDVVRNDAVIYPVIASRDESSDEFRKTLHGRSSSQQPVLSPAIQQDTPAYGLNTALKKNITKRRSQGRPRDRQSLSETSRPLESLVAKKSKPRPIDLDYVREVNKTPDATRVHLPSPSNGKFGGTVTPGSDFTRKHLPDKSSDPELYTSLNQLWITKKTMEEHMNDALEENDERTYRLIEGQLNQLNNQMFALLQGRALRSTAPSPTPSSQSSASNSTAHSKQSTKPVRVAPEWSPDGSTFLIYLEYRDELTPWMVWEHMSVSQLIPTAANLVNVYYAMAPQAPPGIHVAFEDIMLFHKQQQMDIEAGRLSDYSVLPGAVVEVVATLPGGGFGQNRTVEIKRPQPRQESRPLGLREGDQKDVVDDRDTSHSNRAHEKIKQSFKCPRFSGQPKDWKLWNKGFQRFLSIWDLEYVLDPDFFFEVPFPQKKIDDNKLVYYILEDATQGSPLAASYVRQAPVKNGFEAYYLLHDGFVFAGTTTSTILLNELSNFRFKQDETPAEVILRLEELFQDLEMLPDDAAMKFNDTQRIGYLLGALRHEPQWETVTSSITSSQIKGEITFRQACDELRVRCEADKAYKLIDKEVKSKRKVQAYQAKIEAVAEEVAEDEVVEKAVKTFISTISKRTNKDTTSGVDKKGLKAGKPKYEKRECLAIGCENQTTFPLCGNHYHSIVSGKTPTVGLRNDYGSATFNQATNSVEYPPKVPAALLPKPKKQ